MVINNHVRSFPNDVDIIGTLSLLQGFFRRSICKTEPYVCYNGTQDCRIAPGKRTACSHCRYKRCLEVGMSKGAIKTGRYTHELRSKNILDVKMLEKQNGGDTVEADRVHDVSSFLSKHPDEDGERLDSIQRLILEETCGVLVSSNPWSNIFKKISCSSDRIRSL
ncbi:hypothetical protein DPMN_010146 [Dreissena polymorpha]|uniref:Nuclear receptor domain-containing protein n=1 Tax=Dreissena polymorpha TaxID=45954 RepID=A0A9D4MZD9_DREPO|nr:hypothetical protein DPMN_010146 [Dreissena polymorpha]